MLGNSRLRSLNNNCKEEEIIADYFTDARRFLGGKWKKVRITMTIPGRSWLYPE